MFDPVSLISAIEYYRLSNHLLKSNEEVNFFMENKKVFLCVNETKSFDSNFCYVFYSTGRYKRAELDAIMFHAKFCEATKCNYRQALRLFLDAMHFYLVNVFYSEANYREYCDLMESCLRDFFSADFFEKMRYLLSQSQDSMNLNTTARDILTKVGWI